MKFVDKFDTIKNSKLAKISVLKFMFKKLYLLIRLGLDGMHIPDLILFMQMKNFIQ